MAVPKKRTSHSKRNMRRSHHHIGRSYAVICAGCGEPVLRHRVCGTCGQYRGKAILTIASASGETA